jgi:DNA-binding MarR family transcriptional regulator
MVPLMRESGRSLDLTGTGYCASLNFRRTARAVTRLYDAAMQESGMRSTQFAILVGIAKKQPIAIGTLGQILQIDQTTLTRSLRLLRKDGLIETSERSTMRRRFLEITPKGERALARALPYWRKMQSDFEMSVGRNYWNELRSELERLAKLAASLENAGGFAGVAEPLKP